jgi:heme-degrading monooxygenase HmoA
MIRAMLTMKVKAGREMDFEQAWSVVAEQTRRAPGNLRQALLRDPRDTRTFVVSSDWESQEAFSRFERSDSQDRLTAPLREMRESVKMTLYHLVDAL